MSSQACSSKALSGSLQTTPKRKLKCEEDDHWLEGFEIPKAFSTRTQECISTGILSQSCRTEIVQTLVAHMWVHTQYPSSYAYNTICSKLITIHPSLADDAGDNEVAYVSCTVIFV